MEDPSVFFEEALHSSRYRTDFGPPRYWTLTENRTLVEVDTIEQLCAWEERHPELVRVGRDVFEDGEEGREVLVSTLFLGTTMRRMPEGRDALFETLVVGGPLDGVAVRTPSWDEAATMHARAVRLVRQHLTVVLHDRRPPTGKDETPS